MFKRIKHLNKLCIAIIFSALALAIAIGLVAVSVLKNQEFDDPLKGFTGEYEVEIKQPVIPPIPTGPDSEDESESASGSESDSGSDSGSESESDTGDVGDPSGDNATYSVGADQAKTLYLRTGSYGNYVDNTWQPAEPYLELIEEKYPASFLTVRQLEESGASMLRATATVYAYNSMQILPQYTATKLSATNDAIFQHWIPANDVDPSGIRNGLYGVCYYDLDRNNVTLTPFETLSIYEEYESAYREFVYSNYLEIDPELKDYLLLVAAEQGFDPADPEIVIKITDYLGNNTEYSDERAFELDAEEDVIFSFLEDYKQGVCRHYALTATMMLRALGVPARYTYGYLVSVDGVNFAEVTEDDAHAWVEVYVDGLGWKMAEVTKALQTELDPSDNDLPNFKIKPVTDEKLYDGTPLDPKDEIVFINEGKYSSFDYYADQGYTYDVVVSGNAVEPGYSPSQIIDFNIYDPNGVKVFSMNDESVENQFNVTAETGIAHVYIARIKLSSVDKLGIIYNGQGVRMELDNCSYEILDGGLLWDGHVVEMVEIDDKLPVIAKKHPYKFDLKIMSGTEDVSSWYKYEYDFGVVEIVRRKVTIQTESCTWSYDDWNGVDELVYHEWKVSDPTENDGLLEGHVLSFEFTGVQKTAGSSENTIDFNSIKVVDADGNDVTYNYSFAIVYGMLSII